jgi:NAD(P)H-dependent flavin oxidoreductase YrpB (nitropropane dioxygenase family)
LACDYGDRGWLEREFDAAGNARIGCGFITWSLKRKPHLLEYVIRRFPAAIMLPFGSPAAFAPAVKKAGTRLICQVQCMRHVKEAVEAGADIIVAQAAEADSHGMSRSMRQYFRAMKSGDAENTTVWVGEAAALIQSVWPASEIVTDVVAQAERLLDAKQRTCRSAGFTRIVRG